MTAFTTVTLALATALAVGFSACDKDDDSNDSGDLYSPSQSMTNEEILTLFEEVSANMATVRQVTGEVRGTQGEIKDRLVMTAQIDFDAKKEVMVDYSLNGAISGFNYTENDKAYSYSTYEGVQKSSYKVSDAYWNRSADISDMEEMFDLKWNVENNTFVGSSTMAGGATMKMTVTLTSSKRIASIRIEATYGNESQVQVLKYIYSANPTWPSGFAQSDFPLAQQYSVKVAWGEELGESTFYTEPNRTSISFNDILACAPKVSGKSPSLYSNSSFTGSPITSSITVADNSRVLYVKWEAISNAKSASRPAATSLLKRARAKSLPERAQ